MVQLNLPIIVLATTKTVDQTHIHILVMGIRTGAVVVYPIGVEGPFSVELSVQAESRIQLEGFQIAVLIPHLFTEPR